MTWKVYPDSPQHIVAYEQPPSEIERAKDEIYANAVNALAAVFRMDIDASKGREFEPDGAHAFAYVLQRTARLMRDGGGASDAIFIKDVFDQFGPGAVLLALKRAYEQPQPMGDLEGD